MSAQQPVFEDGLSLGAYLRGARLGYGWCDTTHAFVRITDVGPSLYMVDARPPSALPRRGGDELHRVWWSDKSAKREVDRIVARAVGGGLRIRRLRRSVTFVVDYDGLVVRP